MDGFKAAAAEISGLESNLHRAVEDLNPLKVLYLFKRISPEVCHNHNRNCQEHALTLKDCELLALHPDVGRPEDYIWQYISVPPPSIRPSVASDSGNNEDDLTAKLAEIVNVNRSLAFIMEGGFGIEMTMVIYLKEALWCADSQGNWEVLGQSVALYVNSQAPGISSAGGKPLRGFVQRLKGKQGRFRGNLSGKRVDFSSRTVIGPDPNLRIDEVAVPEKIAIKLSYPERVTDYNIRALRSAVVNGARMHPGANIIEKRSLDGERLRTGLFVFRDRETRLKHARALQVGDIVHRHLRDGE